MAQVIDLLTQLLTAASTPEARRLVALYLDRQITTQELKARIDALKDAPEPKEK